MDSSTTDEEDVVMLERPGLGIKLRNFREAAKFLKKKK
jgi:hypothetical protein